VSKALGNLCQDSTPISFRQRRVRTNEGDHSHSDADASTSPRVASIVGKNVNCGSSSKFLREMLNRRQLFGPDGSVGHPYNQGVSGIIDFWICDHIKWLQFSDGPNTYLTRSVAVTLKFGPMQR
jgi:hypothetical protein